MPENKCSLFKPGLGLTSIWAKEGPYVITSEKQPADEHPSVSGIDVKPELFSLVFLMIVLAVPLTNLHSTLNGFKSRDGCINLSPLTKLPIWRYSSQLPGTGTLVLKSILTKK